ncbi:MAG: hypothetical protein Q9184_002089 [Pyrenodesmia sp. 2 TL-2023]
MASANTAAEFPPDPPLREGSDGEVFRNPLLSIEEMKRMLRNAEQRLSAPLPTKSGAQVHGAQDDEPLPHSLPKLQNTVSSEFYLIVRHGVTRVNSSRIGNNDVRRLASQPLWTAASVVPPKTTKAKVG